MKTIAFKTQTKSVAKIVLIVGVFVAIIGALALEASTSLSEPPSSDQVEALALEWFAQMQTGQIDRTQLTPEFSKQLTEDSVKQMAQYLKGHDYGVPPQRAEIVQTRTVRDQHLYVVELVFPRGDAASLLFGFNLQGKITGISLLSMAGD